jgi:acetoin utilization deacetylase AcuC-like enzyme
MFFERVYQRVRHLARRRPFSVWYDPRYRLPMSSIEASLGLEPRRADYVAAYLLDHGIVGRADFRVPEPAEYEALRRVHTDRLLESFDEPEVLARVFAVEAADAHVDQTLLTARLGCGATLAAAREALATSAPMLNLLGGFHHAGPDRARALCPLNDIAVAVAELRARGMAGPIAVIDLDAHPPDGTAECLERDPLVWIGSISGADWPLPDRVDETVLEPGADDTTYLAALARLLERMPRPDLAFVIAGGDVLAADRLGALGLTLEGALRRDAMVADALAGVGSVWLPGGGYHDDSWRVLAGTARLLATGRRQAVREGYDALEASFARVAASLDPADLGKRATDITMEDVLADLGMARPRATTLLGFYTQSGLELVLERYGILPQLRRLGYERFEVEIGREGGRLRVFGHHGARRLLLVEMVLEKKYAGGEEVLYVHWLTLRDAARELECGLPGQEHPGLGMSKEFGELLRRMAERLRLAGVVFTPSWYHLAYLARDRAEFIDSARQGRFEALQRDLAGVELREASQAICDGRVLMNGAPYTWEPSDMVTWLDGRSGDRTAVDAERERVRFELARRAA